MSIAQQFLLPTMGKALTFEQLMARLPGIIAWWPQTEAAGATADNLEGTAARDAAYNSTLTLQGATFPNGDSVALYADDGRLRFGTASLASAWNWNVGWLILWALPDATEEADSSNHRFLHMDGAAGTTKLWITKITTPYAVNIDHRPNSLSTGNRAYLLDWVYSPNYTMLAVQLNYPTNWSIWRNGVLVASNVLDQQSTVSNLDVSNVDYNNLAFGLVAAGAFPHFAMGANAALTTTLVNQIYESIYPDALELFACGDSKTTSNDYWINKLIGNIEYSATEVWRERPYRVGLSGQKTADLHTYLDANLASMTGKPTHCCVNVGSNDLSGGTAEAPFKADFAGVIDALLARWPDTKIWVTKPYREDVATPTSPATLAGWIDTVVATYSGNVAVGNDETDWFAGDIGTYSDDGCHPNTAGHLEAANQWATALGY